MCTTAISLIQHCTDQPHAIFFLTARSLATTTNIWAMGEKRKAQVLSESTEAAASRMLKFKGAAFMRQRLALAVLSGRAVRIDGIRSNSVSPGLTTAEASFLRLLDKITNGSKVEIGYTGTSVFFRPGVVRGGKISHDCPPEKSISWYLEWIIPLAPFAKRELHLSLTGTTTASDSLGADILRTVTLPHLQLFLPPSVSSTASNLELRIVKRGYPPLGGGEVTFTCPLLPSSGSTSAGGSAAGGLLRTLDFTSAGKVRRIRGVASAARVSPQLANRLVESSRGVLNRYVPDLYLFSDVYKGDDSGKSPGYALSLVSTSTTGALHCAETLADPSVDGLQTPEEVGTRAARTLLTEIAARGCVDRAHQAMVLLLMACAPEDASRVRLGSHITPMAIQMLRDVQVALGVRFKIRDTTTADGSRDLVLSCFGAAVRGAKRVG